MTVEMTSEVAAKLRAPFPAEAVGKLPRVWCGKCREANKQRRPSCEDHRRQKCSVCKSNITDAHLHLDYVGHAEITDRLLQADPFWTWEPFAIGDDGCPRVDTMGGLWMRLTVAGVTRVGYGHADGKSGPDAVKEAIGDGLRNCAMRFGVGLDLWGAHGGGAEQTPAAANTRSSADTPAAGAAPAEPAAKPGPAPEKPAVGLLAADRQKVVEWWTSKIEQNGDGQLDATAHVTAADRDVLGDRLDATVTLDDLAAAVLGYWQDHGLGPRHEAPAEQAEPEAVPA